MGGNVLMSQEELRREPGGRASSSGLGLKQQARDLGEKSLT